MADRMIGSLIYGEHQAPKARRPWKQRLKVPLTLGIIVLVIGGLVYRFINYREESRVQEFLDHLSNGRYEEAYAIWDADDRYTMDDFLTDWGPKGYYTDGATTIEVADSNTSGGAVIVYVEINTFTEPIAILVDKETLKLSFSPTSKYGL